MARYALVEEPIGLHAVPAARHAAKPRPLELVKPTRRFRAGPTMLALGLLFFALAVGVVFTQAIVVQRQGHLDQLEHAQNDAVELNQELRLQVAQLESPSRVIDAAEGIGMVTSPEVTYLSPDEIVIAPIVPAEGTSDTSIAGTSGSGSGDNLAAYLDTRAALGTGG